jgi:hypothetical protein
MLKGEDSGMEGGMNVAQRRALAWIRNEVLIDGHSRGQVNGDLRVIVAFVNESDPVQAAEGFWEGVSVGRVRGCG